MRPPHDLSGPSALGERSPFAKLTRDSVREIRASHGETTTALARRFGVSWIAVKAVRDGKAWAEPNPDGASVVKATLWPQLEGDF
ncbi:MAG: hypothetical protein AMXMBFR56_65980 [Polyangiaceae bacterium]